MNRTTSSYMLELPPAASRSLAHQQADELIASLPTDLDASGVASGRAFVRFRTTDDMKAVAIATETAKGQPWILSTGYGVHQREVARAKAE